VHSEPNDPDLVIGHLRLWVHSHQSPNAQDCWDGNWLDVTATYSRGSSTVVAAGSFVHLSEIAELFKQVEALSSTLSGTAMLPTMEPNLSVSLVGNGRGQISATIDITPDHEAESHRFHEELDQTFLAPIAIACRKILDRFPLR
jgi:hypothetical protein